MPSGLKRDINAELFYAYAFANTEATAGSTGDNSLITGSTITLTDLPYRAESVSFPIAIKTTLGAGQSVVVTATIETYCDATGLWTAAVATKTKTITSTLGGTVYDTMKIGCNLALSTVDAVRVKITPNLDAYNTDTAYLCGIAVFGGPETMPTA